jgi:hypothetical protein
VARWIVNRGEAGSVGCAQSVTSWPSKPVADQSFTEETIAMVRDALCVMASAAAVSHLVWPKLWHPWLWLLTVVLVSIVCGLMLKESWKSGMLKLSLAEIHARRPKGSLLELLAIILGCIATFGGPG